MAYAEEMGYDALDVPEYIANEEAWKEGVHYDADDKQHRLNEMSEGYLQACIKKWPEKDTSPLVKELKSRG